MGDPREAAQEDPAIMESRLLTIPEVARFLAVSEHTVRRLIWSRQLPSIRVGSQVRLDPRDLLRWTLARKEG